MCVCVEWEKRERMKFTYGVKWQLVKLSEGYPGVLFSGFVFLFFVTSWMFEILCKKF